MYVHLRLHYRTSSDESELQKGDIIEFNCRELAKYDKNSFFNLRKEINQRTKFMTNCTQTMTLFKGKS